MRQRIIIIIILAVVFGAALAIRQTCFPEPGGHAAYYFYSIFWICGLLIAIFGLTIFWQTFQGSRQCHATRTYLSWPNRRKCYRIIYPEFISPTLVVENADNMPKRSLEYPVIDLSQDGICFLDDGSLGSVEQISGHIRFQSGETLTIAGRLLRRRNDQISVQLNRSIAWSVIMREQRRLMTCLKPAR
jgi:hypothetical protein